MDDLEELEQELAEMLERENGPCAQCNVLMINKVRCHETGCPVEARIKRLHRILED